MTEQPNPNELLLITREELERCCSQMSAAGYKVSANYVEASVLSRSRPAGQIPAKFDNSEYLIGETEIDRGVVELKNLLAMGNLCQDQKDCIESLRCILRDASNRPVKQPPAPSADVPKFNSTDLILLAHDEWKRREERKHNHPEGSWCQGFINGFLTDKKWARNLLDKMYSDVEHKQHPNRTGA